MDPNPNVTPKTIHPHVAHVLNFFKFEHLKNERPRTISKKFHDLAHELAHEAGLDGPELTVALRKLLESKDAAVRAAL